MLIILLEIAAIGVATIFLLYMLSIAISWSLLYQRTKHLPGPKPWPILGHLPHLEKLRGLPEFFKAYGPLYDSFLVYIGSRAYFMIQDPALISVGAPT